jgi:hypothetical protein
MAIFGTSTTGLGIEAMGMERLLKRQGAIITDKFHCAGKFFLFAKGDRRRRIWKKPGNLLSRLRMLI